MHKRNNIIKLQSLIYNCQLSSRYHNLFKYSWFKSGYTNERSEEFENPVEFGFDKSLITSVIESCNNIATVRYSLMVQEVIMFKTFFHRVSLL